MKKDYIPLKLENNVGKGRRIAIGDIHGCYNPFRKLLDKIQITRHDQIFLLGDLIDKGNKSALVLDLYLTE